MGKASRGKRDRRFERDHPKPFRHMSLADVTEKQVCPRGWNHKKAVRANCKVCEMSVLLHCAECEIQITGCLCVAVERMNPQELARLKEEIQRKKAREAGLVLPPSLN